MMKKRVVQTDVTPEVYEFVTRTAKAKGLSLRKQRAKPYASGRHAMAIYRGIPCSTQAGGSRGARRRTPRRWMRSSMGGRRGDEALPGFRGLLARALAQGPGPRGPRPPTDPQS